MSSHAAFLMYVKMRILKIKAQQRRPHCFVPLMINHSQIPLPPLSALNHAERMPHLTVAGKKTKASCQGKTPRN